MSDYKNLKKIITDYGEMEISMYKKPPVWDLVHAHFPVNDKETYYTYGNTLFNPAGIRLPVTIIEHESMHMKQQRTLGPDEWWRLYVSNELFRFKQEMEAYGRQYYSFCKQEHDRNKQVRYLFEIVRAIKDPMYRFSEATLTTKKGLLADIKEMAKTYEKN